MWPLLPEGMDQLLCVYGQLLLCFVHGFVPVVSHLIRLNKKQE